MITRTKNILGIPAAQRQSRDRQQRRRQQQQRHADAGSDEEKSKSRGAAVIRVKEERPKPVADTAATTQKSLSRQPSAGQPKRRRVDIRI
jgi:hypothetical protein